MIRTSVRYRLVLACLGILVCGGRQHETVAAVPPAAGAEIQAARNSLLRLDYAAHGDGRTLIKLSFSHELRQRPPVFATHHPTAYIALDFADTASELGNELVEVGQRDLRALQVLPAVDRIRLVIKLARPVPYEVEIRGNELLVTLHPARTASRR